MSDNKKAGSDGTMSRGKTHTQYDVSPEKFIQVWQTSPTAEAAAATLGMPKPIVHARASAYRKAGIRLKKMPRKSKRTLDVDRLNRLIEELEAKKRGQSKGPKS